MTCGCINKSHDGAGRGISLSLNSPGKSTPGKLHSAIQLCRFQSGGKKVKERKKRKKETKGKYSGKLKAVQENSTRAEGTDSPGRLKSSTCIAPLW